VIGVDTHKHVHVAAVMDTIGGILATLTIPTDAGGFQQLLDWAAPFGRVLAFGIEGTGSYGATLTSFLRRMIGGLVQRAAPQLLEPFGIGVDTAAEILVVAGDNPERIKSEAALAKLAGIAPCPPAPA